MTDKHTPDRPPDLLRHGIAPGIPLRVSSSDDISGPENMPSVRSAEPTAREVFLAWERLRFYYNAFLLVSVFYVVFPLAEKMSGQPVFLFRDEVLIVLLMWNICFCVGPVAEGYLNLLGVSRVAARWVLIVVGILVIQLRTLQVLMGPR